MKNLFRALNPLRRASSSEPKHRYEILSLDRHGKVIARSDPTAPMAQAEVLKTLRLYLAVYLDDLSYDPENPDDARLVAGIRAERLSR